MAKLTRHECDFEFSPWGIHRLCYDLTFNPRFAVLQELRNAWNETEPFEVNIEIPTTEHPHVHILNIAVDPIAQQVTIERSFS